MQCTHGGHAKVAKGSAATEAATYPPRLCRALLRAALQMDVQEADEEYGNARAAALLEASMAGSTTASEDEWSDSEGEDGDASWTADVASLPEHWPEREDS